MAKIQVTIRELSVKRANKIIGSRESEAWNDSEKDPAPLFRRYGCPGLEGFRNVEVTIQSYAYTRPCADDVVLFKRRDDWEQGQDVDRHLKLIHYQWYSK